MRDGVAAASVPAALGDPPRWPPILYGAFAAFVVASAQVVFAFVCFAMALSYHSAPTRGWDRILIAIEAVIGAVAVGTLIVGFAPRASRFVRLFARTAGIASLAVVIPVGVVAMLLVQADLGATINGPSRTPEPVRATTR